MKIVSKATSFFVSTLFLATLIQGIADTTNPKALTFKEAVFARRNHDGKLTVIKNPAYRRGEKVNLILFEVKQFEKGTDGKHQFDLDLVVEDPSGKVILFEKNLLGQNGHVYLEDGIARSPMAIFDSHVGLIPGVYLMTVTVIDKISRRKLNVSKKFTMTDQLGFQEAIFARAEPDGKFSSVPDGVFRRGETVNLVLLQVGPFSKGKGGKHGFDIDLLVTNPKGMIVFQKKRLLRRKGLMVLKNNIAETPYAIFYTSTSQLPGVYQMKMTIYDIFSGKKLIVTRPFTLK